MRSAAGNAFRTPTYGTVGTQEKVSTGPAGEELMVHLLNTDLGFFLSMATRGLRGDYELVGASITTD